MNSKKSLVVGIGEILWDIFPDGKKAGGAPVNFVYHATLSGMDGYAVSAIGDDLLGEEIIELIKQINVKHRIERVSQPTGTVQVKLKEGNPTYTITENVAWDFIPFNESIKELALKTDAVCFGTLAQRSTTTKNTIRNFLSFVDNKAYKILDLNLRSPFYTDELINESIKLCNILKINDEEFAHLRRLYKLTSMDDDLASEWMIKSFNLKYLILTAGADYSTIYTEQEKSYMVTPKVDVVDTVGAGDSFTGAFTAAILNGKDLETAHKAAVERAAKVCTIAGAWL